MCQLNMRMMRYQQAQNSLIGVSLQNQGNRFLTKKIISIFSYPITFRKENNLCTQINLFILSNNLKITSKIKKKKST
jgi:hypothetical protein